MESFVQIIIPKGKYFLFISHLQRYDNNMLIHKILLKVCVAYNCVFLRGSCQFSIDLPISIIDILEGMCTQFFEK